MTRTLPLFAALVLMSSVAAAQAQRAPLRIVTLNAWSGLDYRGSASYGEYETEEVRRLRFESLVEQLVVADPDVIFLQEANPVGGFASRLARELGYDEIHQVANAGIKLGPIGLPSNMKEGLAILARPTLELQHHDIWKLAGGFGIYGDPFSMHFDESNFALVGKIIVGYTPIYLVNTHLSAEVPADSVNRARLDLLHMNGEIGSAEHQQANAQLEANQGRRLQQVSRLVEHLIELPSGSPVIVGGDLNATPETSEMEKLRVEGRLFDAFTRSGTLRGYTWDPGRNDNVRFSTADVDARGEALRGYDLLSARYDRTPRRIDYVLLSHHFDPSDVQLSRVVLDTALRGVYPSDHFGVLTQVDVSNAIRNAPRELKRITPLTESTVEPFPILVYDSDIGIGYGAKLFLLNTLKGNESFDLTAFNSTEGERWYRFVMSIPDQEVRQGKRYDGAVDLVVDYDRLARASFYGTGNRSSFGNREYYTREPLEVSLMFSKGVTPNVVAHIGARYKSIRNSNFDSTGRLMYTPPIPVDYKATSTSIVLGGRYDTRNSYINPTRGVVVAAEGEIAPQSEIGNYNFSRISLVGQYYDLIFYPKTVLALRLQLQGLIGDAIPVQSLLSLGGGWTLRGAPADRYVDRIAGLFNAELRFPIYWRIGGIAALDGGKVWNRFNQINLPRWTVTPVVGLRFYMDTYVVRLDAGFGPDATQVYLNFGQVF